MTYVLRCIDEQDPSLADVTQVAAILAQERHAHARRLKSTLAWSCFLSCWWCTGDASTRGGAVNPYEDSKLYLFV